MISSAVSFVNGFFVLIEIASTPKGWISLVFRSAVLLTGIEFITRIGMCQPLFVYFFVCVNRRTNYIVFGGKSGFIHASNSVANYACRELTV